MTWVVKSIIAMIVFVPGLILTEFLGRYWGTRPEMIAVTWFSGVAVGICGWMLYTKQTEVFIFSIPYAVMFIAGIFLGGLMNIMLFQAIVEAPNPGLPITIVNGTSVLVFLAMPVLAYVLPKFFIPSPINLYHFLGIMLVVAGVALISLK